MRILHIDSGREMRGGQHQVLLLLDGLKRQSHECALLARVGTPLWKAAYGRGFDVFPMSMGQIRARSKAADLIHTHDAHAHTLAAIAGRPPLVVSRRVAFRIGRSPLSVWKYRKARRFLAVSKTVAAALKKANIQEEKIDVVYDGVEVPARAVPRRDNGPIVALASRDPAKGRDLVESAARLLGRAVVFSDDLIRDLPGASVFLYISRSEGFGSAALVAMSRGIPVIASGVGGLTEIIDHEISGILVENEPEKIAAAVARLVGDPELAQTLALNGRLKVQNQFSVECLVERTVAAYRRALAG